MSWAMIKKALNSSLGRQDFMPLNEQINSLKALYASDEVYHTQPITGISFELARDDSATVPFSIKMMCDGTAYFKLTYDFDVSRAFNVLLNVYKNSEFIDSFRIDMQKSSLISYKNGDVFTFDMQYKGSENASKFTPTGLLILGTIQDSNVIKII